MTDIMSTLVEFFKEFNQEITSINVKLSKRGQVEIVKGLFASGTEKHRSIEKAYRKKLVAKDYRFCNTLLILNGSGTEFIIQSK